MKTKLKKLQTILDHRLPAINRWDKVLVTDYESAPIWMQELFRANKSNFYICWYEPNSEGNHHPHEVKEVPLKDMDNLINRNVERLSNNREPYK
jgi:hypothetical protein